MRITTFVALAFCLSGCTTPSYRINERASAHNDSIQDITDRLLVTNILRAKDKAPLHFGEIPTIHESYQATTGIGASILYAPFHILTAASGRDAATPSISIQEAPSFDMNNIDTQDFITGIMSPIKSSVVKYWSDRGLDPRVTLALFFASVDVTIDSKTVTVINNPQSRVLTQRETVGNWAWSEASSGTFRTTTEGIRISSNSNGDDELWPFLTYLSIIDRIADRNDPKFKIVEVGDRSPVGPPFDITTTNSKDYLKELMALDPAKYEILPVSVDSDTSDIKILDGEADQRKTHTKFQMFHIADKQIAFCLNEQQSNLAGMKPNLSSSNDPCKGWGTDASTTTLKALDVGRLASYLSVSSADVIGMFSIAKGMKAPLLFKAPPSTLIGINVSFSTMDVLFSTMAESSPDAVLSTATAMFYLTLCRSDADWFVANDYCPIDAHQNFSFKLRSAGDVVHFLGDLQALEEKAPADRLGLNHPTTLGPDKTSGVLFYLEKKSNSESDAQERKEKKDAWKAIRVQARAASRETHVKVGKEVADALIAKAARDAEEANRVHLRVPYGDETYIVPNATPDNDNHTLEVLAITSALINLNKSAKDLQTTPTVELVP